MDHSRDALNSLQEPVSLLTGSDTGVEYWSPATPDFAIAIAWIYQLVFKTMNKC
ncbi:hypothetical protein GJ744_008086 [Endocarpon pusillum]|uniref:Uncharacterized protein n=1 Tax=Endocarpon pusillum TaxID=364733 RepID=A0A8H7AHW7_9EURO|nr:hypothetical protein GJ744_008086 [Endocarpon pusillum]